MLNIIFADEPTANLDISSGQRILNLLKYFNKEYEQTVVAVSHEAEHVKYFDRIIWLKDGLIEKKESHAEIIKHLKKM